MTTSLAIAIDDLDDPRLASFREIRDRDLLRRNRFIVEGREVVRTLLLRTTFEVESVLLNHAAADALVDVQRARPDVPYYVGSKQLVSDVVGFDIHRGCLAAVVRPGSLDVDAFFSAVESRSGPVIVLDGVNNHDNVGSIFRHAAAFGAAGVVLAGASADPLYRKAIRVSMGAALLIPFVCVPEALRPLHERGYCTVALTPNAGEGIVDLRDLRAHLAERPAAEREPGKVALVVGAEGPGLSSEAMASASLCARIPMRRIPDGGVDSLNAATAAAIGLYELAK